MAEASQNTLTLQGQLIRFEGNPFETEDALRYERDGLIHAVDGKIVLVGDAQTLLAEHPELQPQAVSGILAPGFVDAHLHYPQMRILGAYGEQLYLEEETLEWAQEGLPDADAVATVDSNGAALADGDSVTLIKDLNVKGGGFTAKRGTLVKGIRLTDNPEHVEGRVNKQTIVLLSLIHI